MPLQWTFWPIARAGASLIAQLVKNPSAMLETWVRSLGWEDPLEKRKGYPLQYSGLEDSMDCIGHGVAKSWTRLSTFHFHWGWGCNCTAAAAAESLQSCPTLCNPINGSPPGSPIPGTLQARTLEWVAISFSNAWKWKVKVKSLSCVLTLCDPMDCSPPGSSVHGSFQARVPESGGNCTALVLMKGPVFCKQKLRRNLLTHKQTWLPLHSLHSLINTLMGAGIRYQCHCPS